MHMFAGKCAASQVSMEHTHTFVQTGHQAVAVFTTHSLQVVDIVWALAAFAHAPTLQWMETLEILTISRWACAIQKCIQTGLSDRILPLKHLKAGLTFQGSCNHSAYNSCILTPVLKFACNIKPSKAHCLLKYYQTRGAHMFSNLPTRLLAGRTDSSASK